MIDETLFDRMNFGELSQSLDYVLERIRKIEDGLSRDDDDPRLDPLYVLANKIIIRMDSIIREHGHSNPKALAQWKKVMDRYEERFNKYSDFFLEEDTLSDSE